MADMGLSIDNLAYLESLLEHAPELLEGLEESLPTERGLPVLSSGDSDKQSRLNAMIWAYRDGGYLHGHLNPLGSYMTKEMKYLFLTMKGGVESLKPEQFGLDSSDRNQLFNPGRFFKEDSVPLAEIVKRMDETYCGTLGAEILHIQNQSMRNWLISNMENPDKSVSIDPSLQREIQEDLIRAEEFEKFINSSFVGQKRFSLEGGEAVIPALKYLFKKSISLGIREVVIGMAHRGRLNVLVNAISKPAAEIFAMFQNNYQPYVYGGSGDVKYHMGQSCDFFDEEGRSLHISLVSNPSHLEAVNPVVEGKTRGIQRRRGDENRKKVMPVLIHGDAAFSGQGVVYETLNLSQLKGYRTGGTIHIIINNQIGFTTASRDSRSTYFATDVAKSLPIPIFHANGDDPESVIKAMDLAVRWRHKFGYDVIVDIICYRRLGHNEADEPSFTHPIMYQLIKQHKSVTFIYGEFLKENNILSKTDLESFKTSYITELTADFELAKGYADYQWNNAFRKGDWKGMTFDYFFEFPHTGVKPDRLRRIAGVLTHIPEGFTAHSKLQRFVKNRRKALDEKKGIDWAFAESLAFGSLLADGYHVRLSGEDCGRGTFSQRHARWWDVSVDNPDSYVPLKHLEKESTGPMGVFSVYNSPLSEFSVLGFEYGYSLAMPKVLVLWEAQFGDFANGAQTIIDQFICSGEQKWFRSSGMVLLLPHGYEGQGPEHSNAYLERYLSLCAEDNMQVCNLTTPAQYFHLIRKQMIQPFRKPLILMTPKSLLRHKKAVSDLKDLEQGKFQTVLDDRDEYKGAEILLLCSGKVYYDLLERREELGSRKAAILRLEQIYPFPAESLKEIIQYYGSVKQLRWVQEEPRNKGSWSFVHEPLNQLGRRKWSYVGRLPSASSSTGAHNKNMEELEALLQDAFDEVKNK
ncbi:MULTISPECIES: 2-oxoglutarate dehydrogenase E1 component [unclassified Oceanispirochaeta]|uniref:2-oxoglutarate dehydrogenase E1 component n=1 Tax=unclassified Oceanispirochaeta TaxID=2635722 RepID=UPI000E09D3C4|nr:MULTISPECIES: 2-oxoglutarate dehydrogenase E1 component [unclassified Oceanispirochaeta]MBF9017490.1 2-oxoglutarate dehydrogenase E1 component [Oceanispirochaeta sp. M2]NPD74062.1 2-oxoglutarate dehydrogenase E1 component [Oceanispirochaeta sp. M1]RDG30104.1 2-oxoglutarate dehydrogenase E1 component [Oceanispirochaeta sp. M1]